jgi:hypothetical protein
MAVETGKRTIPVEQVLIDLLSGQWITRMIAEIVRLGVPDHLVNGPRTADELAAVTGVHANALYRVMRALASRGVFSEVGPGTYALTPVSDRLRTSAPDSMAAFFLAETDDLHSQSWIHLGDAIRTGEPRPKPVVGETPFEYYASHADQGEQFGRAMENISALCATAVLDAYDLSDAQVVVDVGGGNGSFVRALLGRHAHPRGVVYDLPYIGDQANACIRADKLAERCRFEPGDFFDAVPAADTYLIKFILHDWSEDQCVKILSSCRRAVATNGRIVVVEMLVPTDSEPGFVQVMDINMLVMTGGRERTEAEFARLFERSGFGLTHVIRTHSPFVVIEGRPV